MDFPECPRRVASSRGFLKLHSVYFSRVCLYDSVASMVRTPTLWRQEGLRCEDAIGPEDTRDYKVGIACIPC